MHFAHLLIILFIAVISVIAAPHEWPRQMVMRTDAMADPNDPKMFKINSRAYLPPRYKDLFGTGSSRVHGSAFIPRHISDFTGKIGALRRPTFSWRPEISLQDGM